MVVVVERAISLGGPEVSDGGSEDLGDEGYVFCVAQKLVKVMMVVQVLMVVVMKLVVMQGIMFYTYSSDVIGCREGDDGLADGDDGESVLLWYCVW